MATGITPIHFLPYPLANDPVRVAGDIEQLAEKIDNILTETIQDTSAAIFTGATVSNGFVLPTYNDTTATMTLTLAQDIQTTASPQFVGLTLTGDLQVRGGDLTTNVTTFNLLNSTATTVNFAGAGTAITIGATTGTTTIRNANTAITGDLAVNGGDLTTSATTFNLLNATATTVNFAGAATTLNIGASAGTTNFAGDVNIATEKVYKINGVSVLSATTLGSSVVTSSLTAVGTVTTGTWSATTIAVNKGGTGMTSYAIGDLVYASGASTLAKLADVATGNVLLSGGVGAAPSYGKVGLTTHVSGTLPVANGGTGVTTSTGSGNVVLSESPTFSGTVSVPTLSLTKEDTATAASHYFVETASDGIVRPKTLANVKSEIVTTAAVNAAAATTVGTVTSGTWSATTIAVNKGGTGVTTVPTSGQILIGNGTGYSVATLTAGDNITIDNAAGSITINSTGGGSVAAVGFEGTMFLGGM